MFHLVSGQIRTTRGMIYNIAVISEFRGTGVGEALFKEAHKRLKEFGAIHFTALVHTGNGGGRRLWRKLDSEEKS